MESKISPRAVPGTKNGSSAIDLCTMLMAACLCAMLTLPVAWNARTFISSDGISYLDMAVNTIRHGPESLLTNGSWSPGYPALLAVVLKLAHPSASSELLVAHSLDWAICAATYLCFTYFLWNLLNWIHLIHGPGFGRGLGWFGILTFAYALLFISNIEIPLWLVGPNIMVEGIAYLVAGVCIRLSLPDSRFVHQLVLGVLMALAYFTKAVMFPLSCVLLAVFLVWPLSRRMGRKGTVVATAAFLLTASPLIAGLSYSKGRMTFSDIGGLNFAWYVNETPRYWDLQLPHSVNFLHPPTILSVNPAIVKFDGFGDVTYPDWYDPSYWYDGVKGRIDVHQVLRQLLRFVGILPINRPNTANALQISKRWIPMFAGVLAFVFLGLRPRNLYRVLSPQLWLIVWPAIAVATFAFVHVEYRYLVPFVVLAWTTFFVAAGVVTGPERSSYINLTVAAGLLFIYGPYFARDALRLHKQLIWPTVAGKLTALGIRPGDELASVGFANFAYDARLVGARFTLQMPNGNHAVPPREDPAAFSKLSEGDVRRTLEILRANGAKALFSSGRPAFENDSGWEPIGNNEYVRILR